MFFSFPPVCLIDMLHHLQGRELINYRADAFCGLYYAYISVLFYDASLYKTMFLRLFCILIFVKERDKEIGSFYV